MNNLPDFTQALNELIKEPSISSCDPSWDQSNRDVIHTLASWFTDLSFKVSIQEVPGASGKYNLLAQLGSGEGGLLLSGHSDTVPFDQTRWHSDPFRVIDKDNKFYGLGTCDMKGFFAFILQVCKNLNANSLKKPLYILATADEETTMAGARFFIEQQLIRPDVAIIGEPTGLTPVVMHKGHMSHRINVHGKSGHSSQPDNGINAIEIIYHVIEVLMLLKQNLQQNYRNEAFSVPQPTLNFGAIRGGDNANRICGDCYLDIDIRALPGISDDELLSWLADALKPVAHLYPGRVHLQELHPSSPAFAESLNSSLVSKVETLTGHCCQAVNYATEAPFIQQLGCQTIVVGPGSIDQAHQPDEYLAFDQIPPTLNLLTRLIKDYCM
ncbi:acetylornithine deacetylase [Thalassotalea mangrovi]|uniref:Acetylornithine deacetylase n=1 Tax=Thalassotalea mangrovi TaxID=2572245 RepID=A0A4U1B821_9GAMM|nr:acetylornithine deacetylase [Thalassotalea mangrovi]TKB46707.1 acetylornithine deacetylase [Thalassotalea mangrovi]